MTVDQFQFWLNQSPFLTITISITAILLVYLFTRNIIARGLIYLTSRTRTKLDDILVKRIKPLRLALLAPLQNFDNIADFDEENAPLNN